jgi:tryptophan synthase beta chain
VLGQALPARRMGKTRVIAESGARQHGGGHGDRMRAVRLECVVYMGAVDAERQAPTSSACVCWAHA